MDILFHVGTEEGGRLLAPMLAACRRRGATVAVFFNADGVRALRDPLVRELVVGACSKAVCAEAWQQHEGDAPCPVDRRGQTINSLWARDARRVVSL